MKEEFKSNNSSRVGLFRNPYNNDNTDPILGIVIPIIIFIISALYFLYLKKFRK